MRHLATERIVRAAATATAALLIVVLSACSDKSGDRGTAEFGSPIRANIEGDAIIDWVDFVKHDGTMYIANYDLFLADPSIVGDAVGAVEFTLSGKVSNPEYVTQDGDAGFLAAGTELYAVNGFAEGAVLAVRDEATVGGYKLYADRDRSSGLPQSFEALPGDRVVAVDVYEGYYSKVGDRLHRWEGDDAKELVAILRESASERTAYTPDTTARDPVSYRLAFHTGEAIGYLVRFSYDGTHYYWSPDETSGLPDAFARFAEPAAE